MVQLHTAHVQPEAAVLGLHGHRNLRGKKEMRQRRLMSGNISPSPLSLEMQVGGGVNIRKKRRSEKPKPELRGLQRLNPNQQSTERNNRN